MVCEISQPKEGPCENGPWLRNNFAAPKPRCENRPTRCENRLSLQNGFAASQRPIRKFSQLQSDPLAHKCHFTASYIHFAATKWLRNLHILKSSISQLRLHFEKCFAVAKPPFGTRVSFRSAVPPFHSCKMGCKNVAEMPPIAKMTSRCEIHAPSLRKFSFAAKRNSDPWHPFKRYKFHFSYSKPVI